MKVTLLLLLDSLALATEGMAQRLSPSVLAAGGASARTATMPLDWTVGEAVAGTERTAGQLYTQIGRTAYRAGIYLLSIAKDGGMTP